MNTTILEKDEKFKFEEQKIVVSLQSNLIIRKTKQELEDMGINYV